MAGVTHYAEHCVVCHGAPGVERGDLAEGLYPRPPNLADAARVYTPGELFWIVKHGIRMTGMPAWGAHSDDELWATVALIEKLPGMTDQAYATLVAASPARDGHHGGHDVLPSSVSSPLYMAVSEWSPSARAEVVKAAWLLIKFWLSGTVARGVAPS